MAEPGEYVSDITEGITSAEDLPKPKININAGVKVYHLAEQKRTTHSLYSRDRPGCQYSIFAGSFILPC